MLFKIEKNNSLVSKQGSAVPNFKLRDMFGNAADLSLLYSTDDKKYYYPDPLANDPGSVWSLMVLDESGETWIDTNSTILSDRRGVHMYSENMNEYIERLFSGIVEMSHNISSGSDNIVTMLYSGDAIFINELGAMIIVSSVDKGGIKFNITQMDRNTLVFNFGRPQNFRCIYDVYLYYKTSLADHVTSISPEICGNGYDIISYADCIKYSTTDTSLCVKMPVYSSLASSDKISTDIIMAINMRGLFKDVAGSWMQYTMTTGFPTANISGSYKEDLVKLVKGLISPSTAGTLSRYSATTK